MVRITRNGLRDSAMLLVFSSLEDPPRSVSLLAMRLPILVQDGIDDWPELIELGRAWRPGLPPLRWSRLLQQLLQRLPMHAILAAGLPLTDLTCLHTATNFKPLVHVAKPLCPLR